MMTKYVHLTNPDVKSEHFSPHYLCQANLKMGTKTLHPPPPHTPQYE